MRRTEALGTYWHYEEVHHHLIPLYFVMGLMKHYQDPPHGSEYWIPTDPDFAQAIDLVRYIKTHPEFASHFCVGVAGECSGDRKSVV